MPYWTNLCDVLHLGDVIEHLTEMNREMPEILKLLKPGGVLVAQGPLEANANFFALVLRLIRMLRRPGPSYMAPYHVILATAEGQRLLFERLGLEEVEYSIRESSWPAPDQLTKSDLKKPRSILLFVLRRVSQIILRTRRNGWGRNRYFYVGRWKGQQSQL